MNEPQLDREALVRLLREIGEHLHQRGLHRTIAVVGGSALALLNLRGLTRDIDAITDLDSALIEATAAIAQANGLAPAFLNSAAKMFTPATWDGQGTVALDTPGLTVITPSADVLFTMKLFASRPGTDMHDMVNLWPLTGMATALEAVSRYYDSYPHELEDPHLTSFVEQIIAHSDAAVDADTPQTRDASRKRE